MKQTLSLFTVLVFCFTVPCFAQKITPCQLKDAPSLRGLKVGMPEDEVRKTLAEAFYIGQNISTESDIKKYEFFSSSLKQINNFKDIDKLTMSFYDQKLYHYAIKYSDSSSTFDNPKEFSITLSEKLNLPVSAWEYEEPKMLGDDVLVPEFTAKLKCVNFLLGISFNFEVTETDLAAVEKMQLRKQEKKKSFKP